MKKSIFLFCFFVSTTALAQVGINTTNPNAQLEIKSSDQANPANTDGILIPKVDAFPAINPTIDQDGMLVYLTTDMGANLKGFYYWDNTNSVWKNVSGNKGWDLTGNSGTDATTNFIGTTDNQDLVFKRNNVKSGLVSYQNTSFGNNTLSTDTLVFGFYAGKGNTAFGGYTLNANTTGYGNVAFGESSLPFNTIGTTNSAVGNKTLSSNTTGSGNCAFGYLSLAINETGSNNTGLGHRTLENNISNKNTAVGSASMYENISGSDNVAIGSISLQNNKTGNENVAVGSGALMNNLVSYNVAVGKSAMLSNTTGYYNTASGFVSLINNTTGSYNTANGYLSLYVNTTGNANAAFGSEALSSNTTGTGNGGYGQEANPTTTTGWNNIGIGFHSLGNIDYGGNRILGNQIGYDNIAFGLVAGDRIGNNCNQSAFIGPFANVITNDTNVSNSTAIGNGALVFQDNMMRLGNSAVNRIESQVGLTVVSDGRYKFNVKEEVKGLDFIKKLRPVVYQYDTEKMDKTWMGEEFNTMIKHNPQLLNDYQKASQIRYSGFIAQEVEAAAKALNYNFSGISKPENADGHYGLDYASFVVPLVKAMQEQQEIIETLKKQNENLEKRLRALEQKLNAK